MTKVRLFTIRTRNGIRGVGNLPSLPPRHVFYGRLVHSLETVDVAWHLLHDDRILCAFAGPDALPSELHRARYGRLELFSRRIRCNLTVRRASLFVTLDGDCRRVNRRSNRADLRAIELIGHRLSTIRSESAA